MQSPGILFLKLRRSKRNAMEKGAARDRKWSDAFPVSGSRIPKIPDFC